MRHRVLAPLLPLWSSAFLGCALFLGLGLLPLSPVSPALLAELGWLATIGAVPTALVLGSAVRAARSQHAVVAAVSLAVAALGVVLGWEHTDFLLSGPRWAMHPNRGLWRLVMGGLLGLAGAAGWLWLVVGAQTSERRRWSAWIAVTLVGIALLTIVIARYRAYDYSMAQLVFPGGVLSAALIHGLAASAKRQRLALGIAATCAILSAGSRLNADWVATGQREVLAHSRTGALISLYVLPHLAAQEPWSAAGRDCPTPRPVIDESPIGIDPGARRNVIIITVDALRKDTVGAVVRGTPVTPELTELSKLGVSFENATTSYPATLFAMGSAFTGLSPAELYLSLGMPETVFTRSRGRVDRQIVVLPDVRWFRLPIVGELLIPGVAAEFAETDSMATDLLVERLRDAKEDNASVMAWIHYYAPHDPNPYQTNPPLLFGRGHKNAYLSEITNFDRQLSLLMQYLRDDGWLEDTLVVFFSDHGEAMGENNYFGHHVYLNGWMIDVPLVLWHASLPPARPRVGVSVADVAPTVLHFLGLPRPADMPAQSLFTLNPEATDRATFSEAFPVRGEEMIDEFRMRALDDEAIRARLHSIRTMSKGYEPKGAITLGDQRLIHHRGAGATLVYERAANGRETPVTGAEGRERSELLRGELERWEGDQLERIRCRLRVNAEP
jgi:hypothetical protein